MNNLYEKILQSLDPFYLPHAAQYFTLVETAESPLTVLQFAFVDEECPESAIKLHASLMDENTLSLRVQAMKRRLNTRGEGFLDVNETIQQAQENDGTHYKQPPVQYLHRTLRDSIKTSIFCEHQQSLI